MAQRVTQIIYPVIVQSKIGNRYISKEQLEGEADCWRSYRVLQKMIAQGLLTEYEFDRVDKLNRQSFSPMLAELMA